MVAPVGLVAEKRFFVAVDWRDAAVVWLRLVVI